MIPIIDFIKENERLNISSSSLWLALSLDVYKSHVVYCIGDSITNNWKKNVPFAHFV